MTFLPRLARHDLRPMQDEGGFGFLLRVAEHNFYPYAHWVTELAGIKAKTLVWWRICRRLPELAHVVGVPEADLVRIMGHVTSDQSDQAIYGAGHTLSRWSVLSSHAKVCALCLRDAPYARSFWDLSRVTACPAHAVALTYKCHACSKPLSWKRSHIGSCDCLAAFADDSPAQVSAELQRLHHALHRIFHGEAAGIVLQELGYHSDLCTLSLNDLIELIELLRSTEEGARATAWSADQELEISEYVSRVLAAWPIGVYPLLKRLSVDCDIGTGRFSVSALFRQLVRRLSAESTRAVGQMMKKACIAYAGDELGRSSITGWRRPVLRNDMAPAFLSLAQATMRTGWSEAALIKLLDAGELDGRLVVDWSGVTVGISPDSLAALHGGSSPGSPFAQCWRTFSADPALALQAFQSKTISKPPFGKRPGQADVVDLLEQIQACCLTPEQAPTRRTLDCARAMRQLARVGLSIDDLLDGIISERLTPITSVRRPCLDDLRFSEVEFERFVEDCRWDRRDVASHGRADERAPFGSAKLHSVDSAAKKLKARREFVRDACRAGLLSGTQLGEGRGSAFLIPEIAIKQFSAQYIRYSEFLRRFRKTGIDPKAELRESRIEPIVIPGTPTAHRVLVRPEVADLLQMADWARSTSRMLAREFPQQHGGRKAKHHDPRRCWRKLALLQRARAG